MPPAEELYAEIIDLKIELSALRRQIEWFKKQLFGGGKTERLDRMQLLLELEALEQKAAARTQTITYQREQKAPRDRATEAERYKNLPITETITIEPEEVKTEPEAYEKIGEEKTFEVDVIPPRLFKREIIRPKYRRRNNRGQAPLIAPAPARAVQGGHASAGLLAWIAVAKYLDHLPLRRLERMSEQWGAKIPAQSMVEWMRIASTTLEPIYKRMRAGLLASGYIQMDETPVRCNDPCQKRAGTTQGYLWVMGKPGGDIVFTWRDSRRHDEAIALLGENYRGILQSDGYEAYANYAKARENVTWACCWAHARRKFVEVQADGKNKAARVMIKLIARLYRREREWDEASLTPQERATQRSTRHAGTLRWIRQLAEKHGARALPKSGLGEACAYLLGHWKELTVMLTHGQVRLDTNLIENVIPISG